LTATERQSQSGMGRYIPARRGHQRCQPNRRRVRHHSAIREVGAARQPPGTPPPGARPYLADHVEAASGATSDCRPTSRRRPRTGRSLHARLVPAHRQEPALRSRCWPLRGETDDLVPAAPPRSRSHATVSRTARTAAAADSRPGSPCRRAPTRRRSWAAAEAGGRWHPRPVRRGGLRRGAPTTRGHGTAPALGPLPPTGRVVHRGHTPLEPPAKGRSGNSGTGVPARNTAATVSAGTGVTRGHDGRHGVPCISHVPLARSRGSA